MGEELGSKGQEVITIPPVVKGPRLEIVWSGVNYVDPYCGMSDSLKSSEPNNCKVKQTLHSIEFFHNSEPMVTQFAQLAKLAELAKIAQLASFD